MRKSKKEIVLTKMSDRRRFDKKVTQAILTLAEKLRNESDYWLERQHYQLSDDLRDWSNQLTKSVDDASRKYLNPEVDISGYFKEYFDKK